MDKEAIIHTFKELVELANGGFQKDGSRYVKLLFDDSKHEGVTVLVNKIRSLDPEGSLNLQYKFVKSSQIYKLSLPSNPDMPIYSSFQDLFNKLFPMCLNGTFGDSNRDFFIVGGIGPKVDEAFQQFKRIQDWVSVCKSTIENHHVSANNKTLDLYIVEELESDKQVKTRHLKISNPNVYNIFGKIAEVPNDFVFSGDQSFTIEKKAVLKSTFLKFFNEHKSSDAIVDYIIKDPTSFQKHFFNDYEFYTRKYSIDKVTREVESAKMEYLDKMNSIIHDNQAKALVIPGVLLGTALVRAWSLPAAVLLLTSMVLALYLVRLNLVHKRQAIDDCEESAYKVLGQIKYELSADGNSDTQDSLFKDARTKIKDNAKKANVLFDNIDIGLVAGLLTWLVYIYYLFTNSN